MRVLGPVGGGRDGGVQRWRDKLDRENNRVLGATVRSLQFV